MRKLCLPKWRNLEHDLYNVKDNDSIMHKIKAPRGHTSIYFNDYLKENFSDLYKLISAKGFTSFNSYNNNLITEDLQLNSNIIMKRRGSLPRPDFYEDSQSTIADKLSKYTDGQTLDLLILMSTGRDIIMRECDRRGIKI